MTLWDAGRSACRPTVPTTSSEVFSEDTICLALEIVGIVVPLFSILALVLRSYRRGCAQRRQGECGLLWRLARAGTGVGFARCLARCRQAQI